MPPSPFLYPIIDMTIKLPAEFEAPDTEEFEVLVRVKKAGESGTVQVLAIEGIPVAAEKKAAAPAGDGGFMESVDTAFAGAGET
jgi:hypothetical protein